MSDIFSELFSTAVELIPPILTRLATRPNDASVGLTENGRTVNWMKNVQLVVAAPLALTSALVGAIVGAAVGVGAALYVRDVSPLFTAPIVAGGYGLLLGMYPGLYVGSVISSVVVPPVSGIANLFCGKYHPAVV